MGRLVLLIAWLSVIAGACAQTPLPDGAQYVEREIHIPVAGSNPPGLDVLEVYVSTPGKHPLALLTHGTAVDAVDRSELTPWMQLWQALWFARRGYVALVVIRKGYGLSSGRQDSSVGGCRAGGSFTEAGEASADDLRAVAAYAGRSLPEVDASTVVSAGVSTGGFAQVAFAASPVPGLKAAISFAGGRGGDGKGHLCDEAGLLRAFRAFGERARIPMLWIYADNDKWFVPAEASKFHDEFQRGGGTAEFIHAPSIGEDGHELYSHSSAWSDDVDNFLRKQHLLPLESPYPEPVAPDVPPPDGLSASGIAGFKRYLLSGRYKAFATNGAGAWGFASGFMSPKLAEAAALKNCSRSHSAKACMVVERAQ